MRSLIFFLLAFSVNDVCAMDRDDENYNTSQQSLSVGLDEQQVRFAMIEVNIKLFAERMLSAQERARYSSLIERYEFPSIAILYLAKTDIDTGKKRALLNFIRDYPDNDIGVRFLRRRVGELASRLYNQIVSERNNVPQNLF